MGQSMIPLSAAMALSALFALPSLLSVCPYLPCCNYGHHYLPPHLFAPITKAPPHCYFFPHANQNLPVPGWPSLTWNRNHCHNRSHTPTRLHQQISNPIDGFDSYDPSLLPRYLQSGHLLLHMHDEGAGGGNHLTTTNLLLPIPVYPPTPAPDANFSNTSQWLPTQVSRHSPFEASPSDDSTFPSYNVTIYSY
jgi:hypothetical protein